MYTPRHAAKNPLTRTRGRRGTGTGINLLHTTVHPLFYIDADYVLLPGAGVF